MEIFNFFFLFPKFLCGPFHMRIEFSKTRSLRFQMRHYEIVARSYSQPSTREQKIAPKEARTQFHFAFEVNCMHGTHQTQPYQGGTTLSSTLIPTLLGLGTKTCQFQCLVIVSEHDLNHPSHNVTLSNRDHNLMFNFQLKLF